MTKIGDEKKLAGIQKIQCKSCRNECMLEVEVKDGEILSVRGNGCRRGLITAERKAVLGR